MDTAATDATVQDTATSGVNTTVSTVFVGGLAWATDEASLRAHFENAGLQIAEDSETTNERGEVRPRPAVTVSKDKFTGRSNGYGFVNLVTPEEANKSIELLHDTELDGRTIRVQLKAPKTDKPRFSSNRGGDRGGYNRGGDRGGYNNNRGGDFSGGRRGGDFDGGNRRDY